MHWAHRRGRPSTGAALSPPHEKICLQLRKVTSAQQFHSVRIPKRQNFQAKDIYLDRLQLEEMAMPAYIWRLGSGSMLALGLANSFFLHLQVLTANDFGRCFQLHNIMSLFVKLCGAVPRNCMQWVFFLFPYIWANSMACHKTYRQLWSWEQSPFLMCLPASKYWDRQPHRSLWRYERASLSFEMHGPSNSWDAAACLFVFLMVLKPPVQGLRCMNCQRNWTWAKWLIFSIKKSNETKVQQSCGDFQLS